MTDPQKYLTNSDSNLRLHDTLIRYKDAFCMAYNAEGLDPSLKLVFLGKKAPHLKVPANSPDLNISSPELGWFILEGESCAFASRAPLRNQKQGLHVSNTYLQVINWVKKNDVETSTHNIESSTFLTEPFLKMLKNEIFPYNTVYKTVLQKKKKGMPLSRTFALFPESEGSTIFLMRRLCPIGIAKPAGVSLYPEYNNSINAMMLSEHKIPVL